MKRRNKIILVITTTILLLNIMLNLVSAEGPIGPGLNETHIYQDTNIELIVIDLKTELALKNILEQGGTSEELIAKVYIPNNLKQYIPTDYQIAVYLKGNDTPDYDFTIDEYGDNYIIVGTSLYDSSSTIESVSVVIELPTNTSYYAFGEITNEQKEAYKHQGRLEEANSTSGVASALSGWFDIAIAPGITIGTIALIMLGLSVVGAILKVVVK